MDSFRLHRLDLEAYPPVAAGCDRPHRGLLVRPGPPLRMGILSLHRLALADSGSPGLHRSAVVHPVADPRTDRHRARSSHRRCVGCGDADSGGGTWRGAYASRPWVKASRACLIVCRAISTRHCRSPNAIATASVISEDAPCRGAAERFPARKLPRARGAPYAGALATTA